MAVQGSNAIAPGRRWPTFRLRTLLLVMAVLGLIFGGMTAVPWVMWRYHVAQALEAARAAGPELSWSFDLIGVPRRDEFLYLLSDRERVLDSLIQAVEHDPDDPRRIHAVQTIRAILKQPGPSESRKRSLDRALDLVTHARLSPAVERELAGAIADWVSSSGLDSRQRRVILAKAKSSSPALLPAWASVLAVIGGREETVFLISLGDTHEAALLNAIHNSPLIRSYWPGLLSALLTRPSALTQRDLVKLVLEHPEALDAAAILRRIVPYHLGAIPADCVPLYEQIARAGPPASRYWACMALLLCTPKTDAALIVIDLIGQERSDDVKTGSWGPIELLKQRFAENFFWESTVWREWWAEYSRKP
jgi:hypothetical protein